MASTASSGQWKPCSAVTVDGGTQWPTLHPDGEPLYAGVETREGWSPSIAAREKS